MESTTSERYIGLAESHLCAPLPSDERPPTFSEVLDRLFARGVESYRVSERPAVPNARWSMDVELRPDGSRGPMSLRVWLAPSSAAMLLTATHTPDPRVDASRIQSSRDCIGVSMTFGPHALEDFHRLLVVLAVAAPSGSCLHDISAFRLFSAEWWHDAANTKVPPPPDSLYGTHFVQSDRRGSDRNWLHSHGLNRCGTIELEMLDVPPYATATMTKLMQHVAEMFIDRRFVPPDEPFLIGQGIELVWLPWEMAVQHYKSGTLGAGDDRDEYHDGLSGVLFAPKRSLFGRRLESPVRYMKTLENNPVLYFSAMETRRMSLLAQERFSVFLDLHARHAGEWQFLIKLGYPADGAPSESDREHLWFEFHGMRDGSIDATLLNEPYGVSSLREGMRGLHSPDLISDLAVNCPSGLFGTDTMTSLQAAA